MSDFEDFDGGHEMAVSATSIRGAVSPAGAFSVVGAARGEHERMDVLGRIAWLWTSSPLHVRWPVELLRVNVLAAIQLDQFMLLLQAGMPVAYCSWAGFDRAAETRYVRDVNSIRIDDWNRGDRMWLIDWVAPFGHSRVLARRMMERFPDRLARAIRVDPETKSARIVEIRGKSVPRARARAQLDEWFNELSAAFGKRA